MDSTDAWRASPADVEERLRVRNRILESMLDLGRAVSGELQMEPLCELVVSRLARTFEADAVSLYFLDEETGQLRRKRSYARQKTLVNDGVRQRAARAALEANEATCGTEETAEAVMERTDRFSLVAVPLKADITAARDGDNATASVPLRAENKVKGVITMTWPVAMGRPTDDDLRLLEVLAAQIAPAIDNAWLYGQLEALNTSLEAKVDARTKELAAKNEQLHRTIEALKQAQAQLVQSEKMSSLGQLTAGIAHEINNPLAFAISNTAIAAERLARVGVLWRLLSTIEKSVCAREPQEGMRIAMGFIEELRSDTTYREDLAAFEADLRETPPEEQPAMVVEFLRYVRANEEQSSRLEELAEGIARLLDRTRVGLDRVKDIVLDLRNFSRLDEAKFQCADLDDGIGTTLSIVRHLAKERGVSLEQERGLSELYPCFAAKINQVVLNLVTNALQATDAGDRVNVRTYCNDEGVFVEVRDTGAGIAPENLSRVFDPFFTTKPVGEGTGLGLSISYKIVEQHHGTIRVWSQPGEGSRFTICLPPPANDGADNE